MGFSNSSDGGPPVPRPVLKVFDDSHFDLENSFFFVLPDYAKVDFDSSADPETHSSAGVDPPYIRVKSRRTDLASVPKVLWGLMSSYGRHTLPALLHDQLCDQANAKDIAGRRDEAYRDRAHADNIFRHALRNVGVEWMRRWMFWTGVTFGRYWRFRRPTALALGAAGLVLSVIFYVGLAMVGWGLAQAVWQWPPQWPDRGTWQLIGPGVGLSLAPYLVALAAYKNHAWALLQVTTYVALPVGSLLILGYVVLLWTRLIPWAVLWVVSRFPSTDIDPGPRPPVEPTGLRFL